jgi:hypothetical protein
MTSTAANADSPSRDPEFDNFAVSRCQIVPRVIAESNVQAVMSVSEDLLCAFELLKPLDGPALKKELLKSKRKNSAALTNTGTS